MTSSFGPSLTATRPFEAPGLKNFAGLEGVGAEKA